MKAIKKAQAAHRKQTPYESVLLNHSVNENPVKFQEGVSQKEAMKKFLLQRQVRVFYKIIQII